MRRVAVVSALLLASCGSDSTSTSGTNPQGAGGNTADAGGDASAWTFVTLKEQTTTLGSQPFRVEFIRADRPDGKHTYMIYRHALAANAPVVIDDQPYAAIDWSDDELDKRWLARSSGAYDDDGAPNYNGTDKVEYGTQSPQKALEANYLWAVNDFASIVTYGRFYIGGTIEDDALDAAAPYYFARTRPTEFDLARIGSIGGSWGGMMSLFGASHAPADVRPRAVVAFAPPSDFVDLWNHSSTFVPAHYTDVEAAKGFYSPYWRRALPVVGSPPGGDAAKPFTHEGICSSFTGAVLVAHDDWDGLIPVAETEKFVSKCPKVEPIYWRRGAPAAWSTALQHGPAATQLGLVLYSTTFLVTQLAKPEKTALYTAGNAATLAVHLQLIVAEQRAGHDVGYVLPRLRELADARVQAFDQDTNAFAAGADVVARAVNTVWKTTFDANGVRAQLATALPTPPPL